MDKYTGIQTDPRAHRAFLAQKFPSDYWQHYDSCGCLGKTDSIVIGSTTVIIPYYLADTDELEWEAHKTLADSFPFDVGLDVPHLQKRMNNFLRNFEENLNRSEFIPSWNTKGKLKIRFTAYPCGELFVYGQDRTPIILSAPRWFETALDLIN